MIRNTFFSMPRFVNLCRKEMVESWKANILRFVMMYGIMAVAFVWNGYFQYGSYVIRDGVVEDPIWIFTLGAFMWALVIMGLLSASFMMERMKSKTNRIAVLMTPATMFEKFFSRWLIFTFGFLVMFLIAFKLADWTRVTVYLISYPHLKDMIASAPLSHLVGKGQFWTLFDDCNYFMLGVSAYFFAQSLFVLGSAIWPKRSFVKTCSAIVVVAIIYIAIGSLLAKILYESRGARGIHQSVSDEAIILGTTIAFFGMAVFNWAVAYFRFKESEIINRW